MIWLEPKCPHTRARLIAAKNQIMAELLEARGRPAHREKLGKQLREIVQQIYTLNHPREKKCK